MVDNIQFEVYVDIVNVVFFVLFDCAFFVFAFSYQIKLFDLKDFVIHFEAIHFLQ
jgi:hypothetical protein